MSLKCGIVGLPNVGKSTLFNCLSSAKAQAANFPFCTIEPNVGVITVPDERLTRLAEIVHPGRIVPATCEIVDIAGLVKGASKGEGLGNKFLGNIRETDAIIHVLRCFDDDNITHVDGTIDPVRDKEIIDTELQLKDLETIEARLAKQQKVAAAGNKEAKTEVAVLEAYKAALEQGKNARTVQFDTKEEQDAARNLFLLTAKPVLYVCNVDEAAAKTGNDYSARIERIAAEEGAEAMVIAAKTEEDIASFESYDDKQMFLEELGLAESGVNRLIKKAYALLNLETFITAGEMEVKAWTYHKGWKAPQCAGVIHTDFESCVIDDFESIFLGTLSRYGKGVLLWNLMLDDKGAPNRPGGCTTCYGAIEISSSDYKTLKYNSHYYDLAQCAKVIRPGAVRIGASGYTASGLTYLAFRNPDGSKAFVALNRSAGEQTVAVYESADRSFKYTIPAKSIASFRWGAGAEN